MKKTALTLAMIGVASLTACTPTTSTTQSTQTVTKSNALQFDPTNYTSQEVTFNNQTIKVRAFENIVYVANPVDKDYQSMNIYIPEAYFTGGTINGYTADTAPIFMPNGVGGYMPAKAMTLSGRGGMGGGMGTPPAGMPDGTKPNGTPPNGQAPNAQNGTPPNAPPMGNRKQSNSVVQALANGFVVASSGARGRTLKNEQGEYYGKAPAQIVDLKASIRYLKANDKLMAGRADRIIVNGTSAGGAMTALLGATGNHKDYEAELNKIGALAGSDSVFAVSSYCPITNLDNADMAYEWQLGDVVNYKKMSVRSLDYNVKRELTDGTLTDSEKALSAQLKANFPNYINSLKLTGHNGQPLTLDKDGNGSFKDEVIYYLNKSVNAAHKNGTDLSSYSFLAQTKSAEPYYIENYEDYLKNYLGRSKVTPAFDGVALNQGENNLFGSKTADNRHFTKFSQTHNTVQGAETADAQTVKLMNPMYYINDKGASVAQHWRIRHGAKDSDTSSAISVILATTLKNSGKSVDFALPWSEGHGGDYDLDELFVWANQTVKNAK